MEYDFKLGEKVIGLESWYSSHFIGTVLLTDVAKLLPLHELLINTSNKDIILSSISEYERRLKELFHDTKLLSLRLTMPYSPRIEKKLTNLARFMNGRLVKKVISYEMEIHKFFNKELNVFLLKVRTFSKLSITFILRHLTNFFLGTIELVLGDIWRFYKSRLEISRLEQQIRIETRNMQKSEYFMGFMRSDKDKIAKSYQKKISKIETALQRLTSEKTDISRAFIAMIISVSSLIISIFALKS